MNGFVREMALASDVNLQPQLAGLASRCCCAAAIAVHAAHESPRTEERNRAWHGDRRSSDEEASVGSVPVQCIVCRGSCVTFLNNEYSAVLE